MEEAAPILFFDSGVGGLSVADAVRAQLPDAGFVYFADSAGFPYGTKSEGEIAARVPALLGRLVERHRPRLVVIACNTASTIALTHVRAALDVPVVGTVPAIKPAAALSRTGVIGVLGTEATIRQPYVDRLSREFASDCRVLLHGAPTLVDLAEARLRGEAVPVDALHRAIEPLFAQAMGAAIDTVVLACTHFPLLLPELATAAPRPVEFVDGSAGIARHVAALVRGQAWAGAGRSRVVFTRLGAQERLLESAFAQRGYVGMSAL